MKSYELSYLISSKLSMEQAKKLSESIVSLIQKEEGVLIDIKNPYYQKLSYPIKKENEAYLSSLTFHLLPEKLKIVEKQLKNTPEVLRFLLLTKELMKSKVQTKKFLQKIRKTPKKEKKVEIEKIEEKLEEILDELK